MEFQNKHAGEACFIICSGTSIEELDLSIFDLIPARSIAVHGAVMLPQTFDYAFCFVEDYYYNRHAPHEKTAYWPRFMEYDDRNALFAGESSTPPWSLRRVGWPLKITRRMVFSPRLDDFGNNMMGSIDALQLAVGMGFEKIFFLGLDCYLGEDSRCYAYDPKTPGGGWSEKSLKQSEIEFERAIRQFRDYAPFIRENYPDVKIFNCNLKSRVDAFPKITFEDALKLCQE